MHNCLRFGDKNAQCTVSDRDSVYFMGETLGSPPTIIYSMVRPYEHSGRHGNVTSDML